MFNFTQFCYYFNTPKVRSLYAIFTTAQNNQHISAEGQAKLATVGIHHDWFMTSF